LLPGLNRVGIRSESIEPGRFSQWTFCPDFHCFA
jgi:uncharacterized cupin superfamily protein